MVCRITAQEDSNTIQQVAREGSILKNLQVIQDPGIENMLNWHIENNKGKNGMDGYRIEIFSSSQVTAKEQALARKVEFLAGHPEISANILFISPNFKVRVGDFRTKNEALKVFKQIQGEYPSAFIVQDRIDFPMLKSSRYE